MKITFTILIITVLTILSHHQGASVPLVCKTGTNLKSEVKNETLLTVKNGSIQRLEIQANTTVISAMTMDTSNQPIPYKEKFSTSSSDGKLTQVYYLEVSGNATVVISGLNVTSQNTDYHIILHFVVSEERTDDYIYDQDSTSTGKEYNYSKASLPLACIIGTSVKSEVKNETLFTVKNGSIQRLEIQANTTVIAAMTMDTSNQPIPYKEVFSTSSSDGTLTLVYYLEVSGNATIVISGLNVTSQNTDYHIILHFVVADERTDWIYMEDSTSTGKEFNYSRVTQGYSRASHNTATVHLVISIGVTILLSLIT